MRIYPNKKNVILIPLYEKGMLARDGAKTDVGYIGDNSCWVNITCSPERVYTIYFNKK